MGWGRMFLLGDWGQQMDIEEQKEELRSLRRLIRRASKATTADVEQRLAEVERDNRELRLHLAALIRYLGHNDTLDKNAFAALVDVIDSEDGTRDGSFDGAILD